MANGYVTLPVKIAGTLTTGEIPSGIPAEKIGNGTTTSAVYNALSASLAALQPTLTSSTDVSVRAINSSGLGAGATGTTLVIDVSGNIRPLTSTRETKENIRALDVDPTTLLQLNTYTYNYKGSDSVEDVSHGFMAEEMDALLPSVVVHKDGKPYSIQHIELIPLIVELLKQHEAKLNQPVVQACSCDCKPAEIVKVETLVTVTLWQRLRWLFLGRA